MNLGDPFDFLRPLNFCRFYRLFCLVAPGRRSEGKELRSALEGVSLTVDGSFRGRSGRGIGNLRIGDLAARIQILVGKIRRSFPVAVAHGFPHVDALLLSNPAQPHALPAQSRYVS